MTPVAVLGSGAFGTALAVLFARAGSRVRLWGRDADEATAIAERRENARYLPGVPLPDAVTVTADLDLTLAEDGVLVVCAVPCQALRETFTAIAGRADHVVWASKGLELVSGRLIHEVAREVLGPSVTLAAVSGPNFAAEIARGLPAATSVAATDSALAARVMRALHTDVFRPYLSEDLVGVEVGGAVKNVIAIAAGVIDGLGFGASARASLITRGLVEMARFGAALGADPTTFMGLAGIGDLVLTASDDQSRNRRFGLALGRGAGAAEAMASVGDTVEGASTAEAVVVRAKALGVEMPITAEVCRIVRGEATPADAVRELLARELAVENPLS